MKGRLRSTPKRYIHTHIHIFCINLFRDSKEKAFERAYERELNDRDCLLRKLISALETTKQ